MQVYSLYCGILYFATPNQSLANAQIKKAAPPLGAKNVLIHLKTCL
jgi:hypothetical protein